jgi:hypothetical protein
MKIRDTAFLINIGTVQVHHGVHSVCTTCCTCKVSNFLFLAVSYDFMNRLGLFSQIMLRAGFV